MDKPDMKSDAKKSDVKAENADQQGEKKAAENKSEKKAKPESIATHLQEQLQTATKEASDWKNKYYLNLAELENMRKRLSKEKQDMMRFAEEKVILDFLKPIDSLEKALSFKDQMSEETRNWALGFEMLLNQLKGVVESKGITAFEPLKEAFDPELHEAVEVEVTDNTPEGTILEVFEKGYKTEHRVIQPAKVKVAKPDSKESNKEELKQNESEDKES